MNYDQVLGQHEVKSRLRNLIMRNRVPHALLFSGPHGCGALPMALAFASHLLCAERLGSGPCGTCSACIKTGKLTHPDLHLVFPIGLSKEIRTSEVHLKKFREMVLDNPYLDLEDWFSSISSGNKQPVIATDEAASIVKTLSYTSFEGRHKVLIMWMAEKMNSEASNKILKILEEPSEDTVFILVSEQADQLLPTILSRVQQIPFTRLSTGEIANALVQNHALDERRAEEIAFLSNGDYSEALHLIRNTEEEFNLHSHFQSFMRLAFSFDYIKIHDWVENNAKMGREAQKQFFQYGLEMFRDCLMHNYGQSSLVRLAGDEKQFLEKFAPFIHKGNYERLIEEFNNSYYHIERNANPKILFSDLFVKVNTLIVPPKKVQV
ncbi:MAG TPA: DNA polymerase III subunit delta' [Bacteroidia bacterium]|nr:DNA polymerase III subunit delta' [Bacteroidia bacterium]